MSAPTVRIIEGDCLAVLDDLLAQGVQVDSACMDPPYHLTSIVKRFGAEGAAAPSSNGATGVYARAAAGFMGQKWDGGDVAFRPETWEKVFAVMKPGAHLIAFSGTRTYHRMACAIEDAGFEVRDMLAWLYGSGFPKSHDFAAVPGSKRTGRAVRAEFVDTPFAEGFGTALKPAMEPAILARKPLVGTIAENVLCYGTGGLNIDECRIKAAAGDESIKWSTPRGGIWNTDAQAQAQAQALGRWPANVMHDGSPDVVSLFPIVSSGKPGVMRKSTNDGACYGAESRPAGTQMTGFGDSGSAARFFYSAKADAGDRAGSNHPPVKPIDLMRWVIRLVTPPGGVVLDCFAGSGTTGEAALMEGCSAILIEREAAYAEDIRRRLSRPVQIGVLV